MSIQPTVIYKVIYLQYEQLHRTHPNWPLSDLRGMTPRQRKHWTRMGEVRAEHRRRNIEAALRQGGVPVG